MILPLRLVNKKPKKEFPSLSRKTQQAAMKRREKNIGEIKHCPKKRHTDPDTMPVLETQNPHRFGVMRLDDAGTSRCGLLIAHKSSERLAIAVATSGSGVGQEPSIMVYSQPGSALSA